MLDCITNAKDKCYLQYIANAIEANTIFSSANVIQLMLSSAMHTANGIHTNAAIFSRQQMSYNQMLSKIDSKYNYTDTCYLQTENAKKKKKTMLHSVDCQCQTHKCYLQWIANAKCYTDQCYFQYTAYDFMIIDNRK